MVLAQAFSFMILLLCTFFEASQGAGFDRCGTDYRCDLTGANLEGNNIFLPNGQEFFQTLNSSEDECACRCKTWGQECKAWTLDKGSNKCYLKTRSSQPQFGPPFANYISGQKECKCVTDANNCIESGLRYDTAPGGPDVLDKIFITSAIGCSCACHRLRNCLVWTFNKNVVENGKSECTLMARATTRVEEAGFDSAVVNCDYVSTPRFCASGWTEFKGACYFLQPKKDWDSANAACQLQQPKTFNAQLTSILNDEEHEFLLNMAGSSFFWIGANRQPRTLNLPKEKWFWQWTDGSNWEYTKWFPGEPNGFAGREFCGLANWSNTKLWADSFCEAKEISICKYRRRFIDVGIGNGMKGNVTEPCADGGCTINTEFGSPEVNPYVIRGIFVVWWDPKFEHTSDAELLAEKLNFIRVDCLTNLGMADPPNPGRGNYYNVYIHHGKDDDYPSGWAQGQGTDRFGNPFLTFPHGLVPNGPSIYHEGYHVFQYEQNSPGFEYRGDSQWYTESSAQWYMSTFDTNQDIMTFVEAGAIVANPQLALWHSFSNEAPEDPNSADGREGWMYGVRQYGMHTLLYFLTEVCKIDREYLTSGFYANTELTPQEYLFENVGHERFRRCFADWTAQNTAKIAYLTREQYERGLLEITLAGTWDLYRPYVWESVDQGSEDQWIEPPQELRPRGWAYNAVRVNNTMAATYTFQLEGSAEGSQGGEAFFAGRIVVQSNNADAKYFDLDMTDALTGEGTVAVAASDYEVALVVASVPNNFGSYQNYQYKVKVTRS